MRIKLYNSLTHEKAVFAPLDPSVVRLYVCGPTVYDFSHIGNARPVIVFDVLFRLLRHVYGQSNVVYTRNITDVDDKITQRARTSYGDIALNEAIKKISSVTELQFREDVVALGCLEPTHQPRATEYIREMRELIERLVRLGVAYVADDHVLFSPSAMSQLPRVPRYGALSRRSLDEMIAGARVDVAPYKREPMDFVLWKPSGVDEPGWTSPCGIAGLGRPGWHIECSAMSMATLLAPYGGGLQCDDPGKNVFDIHGGGIDLEFPHHENEIAQSCCAFGAARMANFFMHNGMLQVEGAKMAKSAGNFFTVNALLTTNAFGDRAWPGAALRLAMLRTHYRQPIDWTRHSLEEAQRALERYRQIARTASSDALPPPSDRLLGALGDDLNTPLALAELQARARKARDENSSQAIRSFESAQLISDAGLLGIDLKGDAPKSALDPERRQEIERLVALRVDARSARDWGRSDELRKQLAALGVAVKDGKDGSSTWELMS